MMGMPPNELGMMIRAARNAAGMTLEDVAERVGVTAGALSHIERGRRLPDPVNAERIAAVLGIEQDEMRRMLDEQVTERRWSNAARKSAGRQMNMMPAYSPRPIEELFLTTSSERLERQSSPDEFAARRQPAAVSARNIARAPGDTTERIDAIEALSDTAASAIRTLRGLVRDEDPHVARFARQALHELEVPVRDEDDER